MFVWKTAFPASISWRGRLHSDSVDATGWIVARGGEDADTHSGVLLQENKQLEGVEAKEKTHLKKRPAAWRRFSSRLSSHESGGKPRLTLELRGKK